MKEKLNQEAMNNDLGKLRLEHDFGRHCLSLFNKDFLRNNLSYLEERVWNFVLHILNKHAALWVCRRNVEFFTGLERNV